MTEFHLYYPARRLPWHSQPGALGTDAPYLEVHGEGEACTVASIILCKSFEWVKGPLIIHSFKDSVEDSFATASSGEGTHFAVPSSYFDEESFDGIGGAYAFPKLLRTIKEG